MSVNNEEAGNRSVPPDPDSLRKTVEAHASHRFRQVSAEQVYDAWLDSARVRAWMSDALKTFGLEGEMRRVEIDARVGGRFCVSDMRHGTEAVHRGEYLELVRPRKIVFTWIVGEDCEGDENEDELPSQVTLTIQPQASGCAATIVHQMDAKWAEYVDRTEQGWTRMLQAIDSDHHRSPTG